MIYLPFISNSKVDVKYSNIGSQIEGSIAGREQWIVQKGIYEWPARWNDCESVKGAYVFPEWMKENSDLLGGKQIIGTKTCPEWARLWGDVLCSPPKPENYIDYAKWVCELIRVYNPWGVELWNEPDCRPDQASPNYFGCWVNDSVYNAGYMYGQFTKVVYPYVKQRFPKVNLLVGALMMVNEEDSFTFLRAAKNGGLSGDYLSFHGYITERPYFSRIFGIANRLKLKTKLPLICTETSVVSWTDSEELRLLQKDYLQYIINTLPSSNLKHVLWYSLANNYWMNTDLQRGETPTPAWSLFKDYVEKA